MRVGHQVAHPWLCPPSTDLMRAMARLRLSVVSGQWSVAITVRYRVRVRAGHRLGSDIDQRVGVGLV